MKSIPTEMSLADSYEKYLNYLFDDLLLKGDFFIRRTNRYIVDYYWITLMGYLVRKYPLFHLENDLIYVYKSAKAFDPK